MIERPDLDFGYQFGYFAHHPFEDAFQPELNLCNCVGPAPGEKKCKCQKDIEDGKTKRTNR